MSDMDITDVLRGKSSNNCQCMAWSGSECSCDVAWPEQVAGEAANTIESLRARVAELESRLAEIEAQEPVGTFIETTPGFTRIQWDGNWCAAGTKLYARPAAPQPRSR